MSLLLYSKDMLEYCIRDTELTWKVAHKLGERR
jgi:hypothetical protein